MSRIDDLRETLIRVNDVLDTSNLSYATREELKLFRSELQEQLRFLVSEEDGLRAA